MNGKKQSAPAGPGPKEREEAFAEKVYRLFDEFYRGWAAEWARQDRNERLYRGEDPQSAGEDGAPRPMTPLVQSIVENVKADLMDAFPEAVLIPERPEDGEAARLLGALIAENHDIGNFREEYGRLCHDLLLQGWCVMESGFDGEALNGIGAGFIRRVSCRSILFDPLCEDFRRGRGVFRIRLLPKERAEDLWPEEKGRFGPDPLAPAFGPALPADRTKTVLLLEYWWKERGPGGDRVHMALFGGGRLLFDSREKNPGGVAPDREYPFAVTVMLPREGSSLGLGFGDSFGPAQIHTDLLDGILLRNMVLSSRNKLLVTDASGFDANDLADWTREVHRGDSLTGVTWFSTPALPAYIAEYARQLRQSAREESGANDFTRGNATGGVTAASAIAALQEAGGKRSRMLARRLQESFREAVRREIEYERARGILPRSVRLRGPGGAVTGSALFDPRCLVKPGLTGPVPAEFFLSVRVSRERRFDVDAHNQLMLTLKDKGMATPMAALRRMRFDGRDELVEEMERTAGEASPA